MSHKPTPEQGRIIDGFLTGQNLVIEAGAGTGKTSTLKMLAGEVPGRRGVYIAYNRSIADDASRSFPSTVVCKTAHGFAYGAVGTRFRHRLNAPRQRAQDTARILRINDPVQLGKDQAPFAPQQLARLVMETIQRFCYSADNVITRWHVPLINGVDEEPERAELARYLVPIAQRAWDDDLTQLTGKLRFTHDTYLKQWILSKPQLPADYVLLDEAQDSNPAVAALVDDQDAQRILVGDRSQAIYGWRGAVDAMAAFQGQRYQLSQSFRFGPAVADEANKWLTVLGAPLRLTGFDQIPSTVGRCPEPDAVLCRSNAGAIARVMDAAAAGRTAALVGGGDDIARMARAALALQAGAPTDHPELFAFRSWREVEDYVSAGTDGSDLKVFVSLVNRYGAAEIIRTCDGLVGEQYADVIVSTAHRAKGREWPSVRIATDFPEPKPDDVGDVRVPREDAMLAYVAVTRAQLVLDPEGLSWINQVTLTGLPRLGPPAHGAFGAWQLEHLARTDLPPREDRGPQPIGSYCGSPDCPGDHLPEDEDWPAPVPAPAEDDDQEQPAGPAPTIDPEPDPLLDLYEHILEAAPDGGWLSLYCLRCLHPYQECDCTLMPDRRWTTTGSIVDFARVVRARLDSRWVGFGAKTRAMIDAAGVR